MNQQIKLSTTSLEAASNSQSPVDLWFGEAKELPELEQRVVVSDKSTVFPVYQRGDSKQAGELLKRADK